MIVLHYRAIPNLRRHVQHAPATPARQPPSARRPCPATTATARAGAHASAWPSQPGSLRRAGRRLRPARPAPPHKTHPD